MLGIYLDICGRIYPVIEPSIYPPRVASIATAVLIVRVRTGATAGWIGIRVWESSMRRERENMSAMCSWCEAGLECLRYIYSNSDVLKELN